MALTSITRTSDQFFLDAYTGKGGFADGKYLVQFPRESDTNFKNRQALAVYPNFTRKVTDVYSGFLWQRDPAREGTGLYEQFAANADGAGGSLNLVLQQAQRLAMLLGTVYLIVDKSSDPASSRADERLPYIAVRTPAQVMLYRMDALGVLQSITFSETIQLGSFGSRIQYRTFTTDGWAVHEDISGAGVLEQGPTTLRQIPVVRLHSTIPLLTTDIKAIPWAGDLAQLNWDLFNQSSELRWLFRSQAFAMLKLPAKDQNERERLAGMDIGPNNALTYDPADSGEPGFIAPPDGPVRSYMDNIAACVKLIYQMANLEFVGGVQQSGVALSFHFQEANRALGIIAGNTEQAERDIAKLAYAWQGQEWKGNIAYPRDFNLVDLGEQLAQGMEAIQLGIAPTFDQEVKKRLARQVLGHGVAQKTLGEIDTEIEAGGDPYGDRLAKQTQQGLGASGGQP